MDMSPAALSRMMENVASRERKRVVTFLREQEEIAYATDMALGHKLHDLVDRVERNEHAGVRLALATQPAQPAAEIEEEEVWDGAPAPTGLPDGERSDDEEALDLVRDLGLRGRIGRG